MLELIVGVKPNVGTDQLNVQPINIAGSVVLNDTGIKGLTFNRLGSTAVVEDHPTFGRCVHFSGAGGFTSQNVIMDIANNFTLTMDIVVAARSDAILITHVSWNSGGTSIGLMCLANGRLQLYISGAQRIIPTNVIPLNTPTNIKLTNVNKVFTLYIDNVAVGTSTVTGFAEQNYPIGLGVAFEGNAPFNGYIKNVKIVQ